MFANTLGPQSIGKLALSTPINLSEIQEKRMSKPIEMDKKAKLLDN